MCTYACTCACLHSYLHYVSATTTTTTFNYVLLLLLLLLLVRTSTTATTRTTTYPYYLLGRPGTERKLSPYVHTYVSMYVRMEGSRSRFTTLDHTGQARGVRSLVRSHHCGKLPPPPGGKPPQIMTGSTGATARARRGHRLGASHLLSLDAPVLLVVVVLVVEHRLRHPTNIVAVWSSGGHAANRGACRGACRGRLGCLPRWCRRCGPMYLPLPRYG